MPYIDHPILSEKDYLILKQNYDNYNKKNSLFLGEFIDTLKASREAILNGECEPTRERVLAEYGDIINYLSRLELKLSSHIVSPSRYIRNNPSDVVVPYTHSVDKIATKLAVNDTSDTTPPYNNGSRTPKASMSTSIPSRNNGSILSKLLRRFTPSKR